MKKGMPALCVGLLLSVTAPLRAQVSEELVRSYLWPSTQAEFEQAEAASASDPCTAALQGVPPKPSKAQET